MACVIGARRSTLAASVAGRGRLLATGSKGKNIRPPKPHPRPPPKQQQPAAHSRSGAALPEGFGRKAGRPSRGGRGPWWWAAAGAGGLVTYVAGVEVAVRALGCGDGCLRNDGIVEGPNGEGQVGEDERRRSYDDGAETYDADVCSGEGWMGISSARRRLLGKARGKVLEVAAGTGANFSLYPAGCRVTATDCSETMVRVARGKAPEGTEVVCMPAESLAFADGEFDTVVDTFGLCSYQDPVRALREMQRVCSKSGGQILLLEHGRSSYSRAVSMILDSSSVRHARRWGCWWNRDVQGLVRAAGLRVIDVQTHHLGTTYAIVAEPGGG